ncbi:hypothetical protein [Atopobacter phocae]|uniref:hypothetical protein n=1 Tax=Atopobacter phocae TaxID=136492 RepID=UPI0004719BA7|nr:hypothetical protein [Atopobacter phocae]
MKEIREKLQELIDSEVSSYRIQIDTGLSTSIITGLRRGERKIDNLSFKTAERLYDYAMKKLV